VSREITMAMKTIVALFDERRPAVKAIRELIAHGIPKERISFVSCAAGFDVSRSSLPLDDEPEDSPASCERSGTDIGVANPAGAVGATLGIGSVLLGVAFLSLPAVGPVLAAGPLLAGIMASGAGAGSTDLPQRLSGSGMPASDAERYARAVRHGGALVVLAIGDEDVEDAAIILARHSPIDPQALYAPPPEMAGNAAQAWPRPGAARPETSATSPPRHDHRV
jgi:hypothetical protein